MVRELYSWGHIKKVRHLLSLFSFSTAPTSKSKVKMGGWSARGPLFTFDFYFFAFTGMYWHKAFHQRERLFCFKSLFKWKYQNKIVQILLHNFDNSRMCWFPACVKQSGKESSSGTRMDKPKIISCCPFTLLFSLSCQGKTNISGSACEGVRTPTMTCESGIICTFRIYFL